MYLVDVGEVNLIETPASSERALNRLRLTYWRPGALKTMTPSLLAVASSRCNQ
jgi:hypothetical protein